MKKEETRTSFDWLLTGVESQKEERERLRAELDQTLDFTVSIIHRYRTTKGMLGTVRSIIKRNERPEGERRKVLREIGAALEADLR